MRPPSGALLYTEHQAPDHFGRCAVLMWLPTSFPSGKRLRLLAGVLLTWPVAKRDRKTLLTRFYRLRRRRAATKVTYPWLALFWIDPQEQSRRETFKQTFHENYGLLRDMSQNYRNSHLLIRSFVLDVLLFGSMIALIWMAFFKQY